MRHAASIRSVRCDTDTDRFAILRSVARPCLNFGSILASLDEVIKSNLSDVSETDHLLEDNPQDDVGSY